MNLRDQLLKAGLASKKDAARVENELRKQARVEQGNREAKRVLEQRAAEAAEALRLEREAELVARRRAAALRDAETLRLTRSRQIVRAHQVRVKSGPQRFWFRAFEREECWRMSLPERVAEDLRRGVLGVVWADDQHPEAVLLPRDEVARVREIRPEIVLFWNEHGGSTSPDEQLLPY